MSFPQQSGSKKRKLFENEDAESVNTEASLSNSTRLQQSQSVYMDDGNIVLVAQNVAFRVHKSILALRSQAFRDMLAVVSPNGGGQSTFDECPVIQVSDTEEQLECLLKFLYQPIQISPKTPLKILLHITLLGHKYMIDDITALALEALKPLFPDNFDAWWESEGVTPAYRETFTADELAYAVKVAQVINSNAMRAIALFLLVSKPLDHITANIRSIEELGIIMRGREELSSKACTYLHASLHSQKPHSPSFPDCRTNKLYHEVFRWTHLGMFSPKAWTYDTPKPTELRNVLSLTSGMFDAIGERLCLGPCRDVLHKSIRLRYLWESIPGAFRLTMTPAEKSKWEGKRE